MVELEDYFSKIHHFKYNDQYILPNKVFDYPKWSVPALQEQKRKLNEVKGLLGKYKLKEWSKHTAYRDPSGFVIKKLSETVHPELLTQAWCKFYEILAQFHIIPKRAAVDKKLSSLHLCEAPGAFVCALNHYLTSNYPNVQWNWTANTLNPNYEGNELSQMIPDDRLIRYTLKNWYFGLDFTGDITKYYNYIELVRSFEHDKVDLVSADGSVDCMKDPGEQERHVEFLHFCETISALAVLQTGGTFVLKIFTIFEDTTISLLFLLNCLFEKVSVFKPCTSKSGNSEVYVINKNFKGFDAMSNIWHGLTSVYNNIDAFASQSMFVLSELPQNFLEQIHICVDFFMVKQIRTILDNIYFFENKRKNEANKIYLLKTSVAQHYIFLYDLKWIFQEKKIVPQFSIGDNWRIHALNSIRGFTYVPVQNFLKHMLLENIMDIKIGKKIRIVQNSKFVQKDTLQKIGSFSNDSKSSGLYNLTLKHLAKNNVIINVKEFHLNKYHEFQKNFFDRAYNSLERGFNLIFINIPFHTHFLVGVLYILFYAFEKIYFGNGVIILYKCNIQSILKVKETLSLINKQYNKLQEEYLSSDKGKNSLFEKDIIQIIPPNVFDETYSSFVGLIWNYNSNIHLKNMCARNNTT